MIVLDVDNTEAPAGKVISAWTGNDVTGLHQEMTALKSLLNDRQRDRNLYWRHEVGTEVCQIKERSCFSIGAIKAELAGNIRPQDYIPDALLANCARFAKAFTREEVAKAQRADLPWSLASQTFCMTPELRWSLLGDAIEYVWSGRKLSLEIRQHRTSLAA